ncbi:MAG: hypothetical protein M1822_004013 [Bathelium mastoideum]|nr:MAG: hypothetical protein M1822_004013 [Bathelium mastoideum]
MNIIDPELQDAGLVQISSGRNLEMEASRTEPSLQHPRAEKFRYHVTLNAPTAMLKRSDDTPLTYLNKGQTYSLSIRDTAVPTGGPLYLKDDVYPTLPIYRTYVRISFDDEYQRALPESCWQLWKEGRGIHEAHHRHGSLQAVEFVDPDESTLLGKPTKPQIKLESASTDGFVVNWWCPTGCRESECSLPLRFHFLSTDFSHSKGVKGIPVRLCVKMEMKSYDGNLFYLDKNSEVCYCKVKLFRDHGAERKSANDVAHVKKTIEKLEQKTTRFGPRSKYSATRISYGSNATDASNTQVDMVSTRKRAWSTSFGDENYENTHKADDLHSHLAMLQDMLRSTRPDSILFLKGDELDDPDLHPVLLSDIDEDLQRGRNEDLQRGRNENAPTPSRYSSASARSYSSRASSPPRASSTDFNKTEIMPPLIPFEDYLPVSVQNPPWSSVAPLTPSQDEYKYSPLKLDDVRLLALLQGVNGEDIHCSLKIMPISRLEGSQLGHQALSYAWGDEPACEQIFLNNIEFPKDGLS